MDQAEFDRTTRQIHSLIYCNELDKAAKMLLQLIESQQKAIEDLKKTIKDN